ncbi:MAG: CBS domain-containing protein [Nitrospirae bacterium]|nr:CBS domain-containing protein [Nitrospirota bacterium]
MAIDESVRRVNVMALEMPEPVVLDQSTAVREVIEQMRERKTGVALLTGVGDPAPLTGIFTERDVLLRVLGEEGLLDRPAEDLMATDPATVSESDSVERALAIMNREGFRHVPVLAEDGRVVACVRHKDMIRYLVEHFAERLLNLPPDPDQVATSPEGG